MSNLFVVIANIISTIKVIHMHLATKNRKAANLLFYNVKIRTNICFFSAIFCIKFFFFFLYKNLIVSIHKHNFHVF